MGTVQYVQGDMTGKMPLPFEVPSSGTGDVLLEMTLDVPQIAPRWYRMTADDCVSQMVIDGRSVPSDRLPFCLPGVPQRINLGGLLPAGMHRMTVAIYDVGGFVRFDLQPSLLDPVLFALILFGLFIVLTAVHIMTAAYRRRRGAQSSSDEWSFLHLRMLRCAYRTPVGIAVSLCILSSAFYLWMQPRVLTGYVAGSDGVTHLIGDHFQAPTGSDDEYDIFFWIRYGFLRPPTLRLIGDDCIRTLFINGVHVHQLDEEVCDFKRGANIRMSDEVHTGINTIQTKLRNSGGPGSFRIEIDSTDPLASTLLYIAFLSGGIALWLLLRRMPVGADPLIASIFWIGIALRFLYFFTTPFYVRANDVDGHIEYMHFIMNHLYLPSMTESWESFQPPLYYIVGAGMLQIARVFGWAGGASELVWLQTFALILSVIGFFLGATVLRHFLSSPRRRIGYACALALLATFPGLVYFASRINNDVLVQFLIIVSVYGMIRFHASRRRCFWLLAVGAMTLGIFTKTNALLLLPPLLLVTVGRIWPFYWRRWLLAIFTLAWAAGCYLGLGVWRSGYEDLSQMTNIVTNVSTLNTDLTVPNAASSYYTFSPAGVLTIPFNNAWSDDARRQYFWEYLLRSSFFGEFGQPDSLLGVARALLLAGMLCLPIIALGILAAFRRRMNGAFILFAYILSTFALHAVFRWQYPYSTSQDFRYITAVTIAFATFIGIACAEVPVRIRPLVVVIAASLAVLSAAFLFALFVIP